MSGICGQFNLDDAPVAAADLGAMTAMLEIRGPERTGRWRDGLTGLGHTLLATTPEMPFERQPFTHPETGCVITADVRLDNRNEIIAALDLRERREPIGDAEMILLAYLEWGEDCPNRLLGDFAFAIVDPRHQALFCARDHFGMRPFYYHHLPSERFIFASDTRAILVLPMVPYRINNGRVADFLVPQLEWIDYTSTFFEGINRLPPGHKLSVTPSSFSVAEYWSPTPGPELPRMSDEEYRDGFLEVFTQAVRARLRAPAGTVGSMLSGGMDSGSVAAVASELLRTKGGGPLRTVSAARERGFACDESRRIYASVDMLGSESTIIQPESIGGLDDQLCANLAEPFDGEFLFMKAIYLAAREQGLEALIDGGGGDIVLSEGSYITRLLRRGHLATAYREIRAAPSFRGETSSIGELFRSPLRAAVPEVFKAAIAPYRRRIRARGFVAESLISQGFAEQVNISERCEQMWRTFPADWVADSAQERVNKVRPNVSAGRERYGRLAASAKMEAADPFLDLNVVAYCSQLPSRLLLSNGWPKFILRDAMAGKLPAEVRWGRGKPHIGAIYNQYFLRREKSRGRLSLDQLRSSLCEYVNAESLEHAWREFEAGGEYYRVHSAYVLSLWIEQTARRPVVKNQGFG